jgi:hypothetical protein
MNEFQDKLIMILYECNQHKRMISYAFEHIEPYLPLTQETYCQFSPEEIGFIDQFLFRFSKLQDTMGEKLFKTMLYLLGEDFSHKPVIDMLNRLEQLSLLTKNEWMELRTIRNNVDHEYSIHVDELITSLNAIFAVKDQLLEIYNTCYTFCSSRFEFVKTSAELQ